MARQPPDTGKAQQFEELVGKLAEDVRQSKGGTQPPISAHFRLTVANMLYRSNTGSGSGRYEKVSYELLCRWFKYSFVIRNVNIP